ncbi:hypothetical protein D9M68_692220 [compost metagenome]
MLRVQADEALGGGPGGLGLDILVVGVDQFELRLLGIAAERVARLQCFQLVDGAGVALVVQVGLCLLVQLGLAEVLVDHFLVRGTGGGEGEGGDQQQVFHLHGGLRPCDGRLSWPEPSCYDEPPAKPGRKDAVFNHKRAAETKGRAPP